MRTIPAPAGRVAAVSAVLIGLAWACLPGAGAAAATLYKWVDASGVTHYSDRPAPGAQRIEIGAAQGYAPVPAARSAGPAAPPRKGIAAAGYTRVAIEIPEEGAVFVNQGNSVQVSAAVEPELAPGHEIRFVLDGTPLEGLSTSTPSAAIPVSRGDHTIAVTISDGNGHDLISSAPVSFSVRAATVANPPRGPGLPPVRPRATQARP